MKGKVLFAIVAISVLVLCDGQENGNSDNKYYTIVAPSSFRANSRYRMSFATTGLEESMEVLVTLTNGQFKQEQVVTVPSDAPVVAFFDIGAVDRNSYNYKLQVEGRSGIKFKETASVYLNWKQSSVLIQTDKGMYKPSDRVQFRVMVVDGDTKPVNLDNESVQAYIQDPKGNKIKQWSNIKMRNGVFKGDLKLSREPAMGYWYLYFSYGTDNNKVLQTKSWEVAEYVLPKFEVITSQPVYNTYKSGKVVFGVEAKYTYGKPVKGTVTVKIDNQQYYYWNYWGEMDQSTERYTYKVIPIDGKAVVELDLKELKIDSSTSYTQYRYFELTVLEELTGISMKGSISVPIYVQDYQISHSSIDQYFKPGLKFSFNLIVTRPDGKPINDKTNPVNVVVYYGFDNEKKTDLSLTLNDQGLAFVSVTTPLSAKLLDFEIKYRDAIPYKIYLPRAPSESSNYIQADILTKPMDIFKFIRVRVTATETMKYLYYQVIGRGGVQASHRRKPNSKEFVFSFWATFAMVPEAALVVYYYRPNGEIIADRVDLKFEDRLDNYANIKLSATQLEPGKTVEIKVDAKCNSYVGLLGIDQSVKLLRSGNDIDKQQTFYELRQYNYRYGSYPDTPPVNYRQFSMEWQQSYGVLVGSGAIFFTNAKKYELKRNTYYETAQPSTNTGSSARVSGDSGGSGGPGGLGALGASTSVASEMAAPNSVANSGGDAPITVRKEFPETWIWEDFITDNCDTVKLSKTVPDTITSWLISAFSLNAANGLGLNENPTSLTVFRPFFISTSLPYSVKRGEKLTLSIQIFNYLASNQDVSVTMSNEKEEFKFTDDTDANFEDNKSRMNLVTVKSNTGSTITFTVTPRKIGYLPIKITARCELAGDAIEQLLLVEPEGTPIYVNKAILLDMRTVNTKSVTFSIETPDIAVPDSTSAEVSVFGDFLGNTIQNMESLIRIPYGCGEQNMVAFVPNLLVADYLTAAQQLTTVLRIRIVSNLEIGYQRELNYQRNDGSFSCWGQSDRSGSTWLTAFVVRYFAEAKAYISIDDNVMTRAMDWLVSKQSENGRFTEVGKGVVYELQSEASEGVGLTAHVLLALMTNNPANKYGAAIKKATDYIVERLKTVDHLYSLALSAYALQKQGHSSASSLLDQLNKKAKEKDGFKWWENKPSTSTTYWWSYTSTTNIEITAIALATYAEAGLDTESIPILQWLVKERNSRGGYYSTQDTILSIQALTKIASRLYVKNTDIDVAITYDPNGLYNVKVNRNNAIALQSYELPLGTKTIKFDCKGTGFAVAQVAYKYYVLVPEPEPKFNLEVKIIDSSTAKNLQLSVCSSFIADKTTSNSNMAIVEIAFPSGYTFNRDTLEKLRLTNDVSRVETKDLDTVLMIYYYSIGEKEVCLRAEALKTSNVALLKPAPVKVYDYYDNSKRARKFYDVSILNAPTE